MEKLRSLFKTNNLIVLRNSRQREADRQARMAHSRQIEADRQTLMALIRNKTDYQS
jgi:hypothetical protein